MSLKLLTACLMCCLGGMFMTLSANPSGGGIYTSDGQDRQIRINGTVTDVDNNPIPGAAVMLKTDGAAVGTITDIDGNFFFDVPGKTSIIVVSSLGFKTVEIMVGSRINFNIRLEADATALDEVVVTGYGSQTKASIVGAIEGIQPSSLQTGATRSVTNNLAGRLAGVIAVQRSGETGYDNSSFWIRGISTFSGTTTPLVLVDGVERDLNHIDPAEIESFSILKDASATAMYGVRGANGIIVINTKRGKVAPPSVNFRIEHAISQPTRLPEFIGAADYMDLLNELAVENSHPALYTAEQIRRTRYHYDQDLYPDVNWIDEVTKDYANSTRANLTVSGGSDFLRYSLVASYYNEHGITETDHTLPYDTSLKLNRYSARANIDLDVTKTTLLRLNIGGYMQNRRSPNVSIDDVFNNAFLTSPNVHPARYSDGTIPIVNARVNPWASLTQVGFKENVATELQTLIAVEQNLKMITPGLKAKVTFSFDSYSVSSRDRSAACDYYAVAKSRDEEGNLIHNLITEGRDFLTAGNDSEYGAKSMYLEATLTYDRKFNDRHSVNALFLYNQQSDDSGSYQPYRKQGIAGRMSYSFDNRYVAEFNFGYNGSENFAKGMRFGFFPSFAAGWILSEEPFMQNVKKVLSKMKFRGSYGKVGNDNIGGRRFAYLTTVWTDQSGYAWGENGERDYKGISEGDPGVTNLTWETAWKADVGIEIGLWNSLTLQVDWFNEKRRDIFMQRKTIPTQTGYTATPWANFGRVTNCGVDASLEFNRRFGQDWFLSVRGTFTYAKNRVDEYDETEVVKGTHRSLTGRPLNTLWGLTAERLFTEDDFDADGNLKFGIPEQNVGGLTRPGDIKYVDMNGDGVITEADEGYIGGTFDPKIVYGFGASISYRHWDLSFFFQGVGDSWRIIGGTAEFIPGSGQGLLGNVYSNYQDRWTVEHQSQDVFWPRLSEMPNKANYRASTWWKKNMSFLRCKTIELGYSLPERIADKLYMKGLRIFVSGNNLFCLSDFDMWDPELDTSTGLRYPPMRSFMFGIDVTF